MAHQEEMVIFTRSFDFLTWLLPITNHFPKAHRFAFTQRLLDAAFDLREHIEMANLRKKDARLEQLRLAARWKWLSKGQYRHAAGMVAEIGRLLGGWIKTTKSNTVGAISQSRS
jgi:hypothetical protein